MLRLSLMSPKLHSQMFVAMLDAYFEQDIAKVWEASRFAAAMVPGLEAEEASVLFARTEQQLLIERNKNWIPVIKAHLKPKTVVAAGAAHLIGEQGLLRLLEREGWTIAPYQ